MPKNFQNFWISQKGMVMRNGKCLIVRLFDEPGHPSSLKWDLPGGRIDKGEDSEVAFRREMEEETGLKEFSDFGVADYIIDYPAPELAVTMNPYCGIIRIVEANGAEEIRLSPEHCEMKWITKDEVDDYVYCWTQMPKMIKRGFEVYKKLK
jgi:8-oxo-dGTP pyrophosphatase MutT (NUDIX family)